MPIPTTTAIVHTRMGMVIRMAIGALITDMVATTRIIGALTTLTIATIIDTSLIDDIGSH